MAPGGSGRQSTCTDEDKLAHLHTLFRDQLTGYVIGRLFGDRLTAEDIVQETFARAWRYLRQHDDVDVTELRPWLYIVARHLVIDTVRARRVRPVEVSIERLGPVASKDDCVDRMVEADRVRRALLQLSPDHRTILIELYFHDRPFEEVAQRLDIPVGTVRSRSHYAKRTLRTLLDEQSG